jgi:hypothetical protein
MGGSHFGPVFLGVFWFAWIWDLSYPLIHSKNDHLDDQKGVRGRISGYMSWFSRFTASNLRFSLA